MEFVLHPTLPSQITLGPRVALGIGDLTDQSQAQQVLVAIVKSTFLQDDSFATPLPAPQQLPLFLQDVLFNSVRNADFATGAQVDGQGNVISPVAAWKSEGPTISQVPGPPDFMHVVGGGRIIQTLVFERPLKGRTFRLHFQAHAEVNLTVSGIRVESKSGVALFNGNRNFVPGTFADFIATATWPANLEDNEATLVLEGSGDGFVDYDRVQFTEGSAALDFAFSDVIRYEHDLAIFKPRTDIIVLGAPAPPDPGPIGGAWTERVQLNGEIMSGTFTGGALITFGWQDRLTGTRNGYAGNAGAFNPNTMKLPLSFNNRFFNGGRYSGAGQPFFSHPAPGAIVTVETTATYDIGGGVTEIRTETHRLHLPAQSPQAVITYRTGDAMDSSSVSENLQMNVDTIVYQKDTGRFYVVWRGVWEYASVPAERYVSLVLS